MRGATGIDCGLTLEIQPSRPEGDSGHAITDLFERLVAEAVKREAQDDSIAAALEQATQGAADVLAERLRADAPRMLREQRDFRRGFEGRLQQRWDPLSISMSVFASVD